ncbi:hypothetical protein O6H91_21G059100 [Diphasiastrum complanatum]|nr:hypothetical protein O6H91_21G059100 [Diphasiastrum complanatum]KAJ7518214.1 hypothetical protein O6H91_21G059100 [Diphasiastrum complanatum]KAJ7518215.1 hypothetical protein O6H91_21G059100 [Diphasiastrum complanatum]
MSSRSDKTEKMNDRNVACCTRLQYQSRDEKISRILLPINLITAITALLLWAYYPDRCRATAIQAFGEDLSENRLGTQSFRRELQTTGLLVTQDYQALLSLKTTLESHNGVFSPIFGSWAGNATDPCSWNGIGCGIFGGVMRVRSVNLSNSVLRGFIPLELTNLTALVSISLQNNQLNGTIPPKIGTLSYLTSLDLSNNSLSGPIPIDFGGLTNLQFLNLAQNALLGGIPMELLSNCGNLNFLNVSFNMNLGGLLPAGWKNCQNLTHLDLAVANVGGGILVELGELPALQYLNLGENNFTGEIPSALFANCRELNFLDLSCNHLVGAIPAEVGNCSKLTVAMFSQNNLSSIPPEIGQLTDLNWLLLGQNGFVGEVPSQLSSLANLTILDLKNNSFSGSIPSSLSQLKSLEYLFLQRNMLTGSIPAEFSALPNLIYFDLANNLFTGTIPSSLGNLSRTMQFLFLCQNQFTGRIPSELGNLINLQILDIGENQLTGSIPGSIFNLQKLLWLRLSNNRLSGQIPNELNNSTSLMWLNLANNSLSGPLPQNLSSVSSTVKLTFQLNIDKLFYLPRQLGDKDIVLRWLPRLGYPYDGVPGILNRDDSQSFWNFLMRGTSQYPTCQFLSAFAGNGYLQIFNNRLSGSLPPDLGNLTHVNGFHMSNNNFSGAIPPAFNKAGFTFLELANNSLTGEIPTDFGGMRCALVLQLEYNNLSGKIPDSLQQCDQLNVFNVSYNPQMSGPVPFKNQFSIIGNTSYLGDDLLCDAVVKGSALLITSHWCSPTDELPPAGGTAPHSSRSKPSATTIVGIILGCTLGALVIGVIGFCIIGRSAPVKSSSKEFSDDEKDCHGRADTSVQISLFSIELPKQLTYTDLLMATNNFDEGNVVGSGGFGVVYKARLMDGSLVAIKKLIQEGAQADREFLAEMETLGHVHHDNLVPLLGCSTFGSEKLLVYRFMANGSLDDWLHERPEGRQKLGWPLRLNIALGMAKGLKFLHHSCSPPIIHRDMKASNILLDENFEPRLTDFGLARVLGAQETHVSTMVAGTLGYVPPEYCQTWRATIKGDVFSFGVVLLELITGRRPMDSAYNDHNCSNIVEWVIALVKEGSQKKAYDHIVANSGSPVELLQFLKLATWCIEDLPIKRPTMREVLKALEEIKGGNYANSGTERKF